MPAAQETPTVSTRYSPIDRLVILGTPLLFAVVMLLHPQGDETKNGVSESLEGQAGRWVVVHVAQLFLTVLLGVAVWTLLDGQRRPAAIVSRLAIATFMVFFSAYDAVAGLVTGILVRYGQHLSGQDRTRCGRSCGLPLQRRPPCRQYLCGWGGRVGVLDGRGHRHGDRPPKGGRGSSHLLVYDLSLLFSGHGNILTGPLGMFLFLIPAFRWERQRMALPATSGAAAASSTDP